MRRRGRLLNERGRELVLLILLAAVALGGAVFAAISPDFNLF